MNETDPVYSIFEKNSDDYSKSYLAHLSIDCVIFAFNEGILKVLVLKLINKEEWSLPGGYVKNEEDIDQAATRILKERTGINEPYLQQFKCFGATDRNKDFFAQYKNLWMGKRFISIGYYALIDSKKANLNIDQLSLSDHIEWKSITSLPVLMMDHHQIIQDALIHLRRGLNYYPIGLNLLPERFTMPELQTLYEAILNKKLNRGNFYRKMMRYNLLTKQSIKKTGEAHRSPILYSFNLDTYRKAMLEGFKESW